MTLKNFKKTRKNKKPRKNKKITQNKKKLYKKNLVGGVDNIEWNKGQYSVMEQWIEHKRQIEEQKHIEPQDKAHQDAILRQTQELLSEQTIKKRKTPISKRNKPVISEKLINDAIKELVIENEVDNLKFTDNELKKLEKLLNQKDSTR